MFLLGGTNLYKRIFGSRGENKWGTTKIGNYPWT